MSRIVTDQETGQQVEQRLLCWYPRLITKGETEGLLSTDVRGKFIVCEHKEYRKYASFSTSQSFYKYMMKPDHKTDKCYYEVILGHLEQKPKFDIDLAPEECSGVQEFMRIISDVVDAIKNTLQELGTIIKLDKDIVICPSFNIKSNKVPSKYSCHIIVDNYCCSDNEQSRALYYKIMSNYTNKHCVDHMVYSRKQLFRLLHCHKYGKDNIKRIAGQWKYHGKIITYCKTDPYERFLATLVTDVGNCRSIKALSIMPKYMELNGTEIDDEDVQLAYDACSKIWLTLPFDFGEIRDNMIILAKRYAWHCIICKKEHNNNNAYLTICHSSGEIRFHCYMYVKYNPKVPYIVIGRVQSNLDKTINQFHEDIVGDNIKINESLLNLVDDEETERDSFAISQGIKLPSRKSNIEKKSSSNNKSVIERPMLADPKTMEILQLYANFSRNPFIKSKKKELFKSLADERSSPLADEEQTEDAEAKKDKCIRCKKRPQKSKHAPDMNMRLEAMRKIEHQLSVH